VDERGYKRASAEGQPADTQSNKHAQLSPPSLKDGEGLDETWMDADLEEFRRSRWEAIAGFSRLCCMQVELMINISDTNRFMFILSQLLVKQRKRTRADKSTVIDSATLTTSWWF
jgi:hypothetical protein